MRPTLFVGISRSFKRVREVCDAHGVPMMMSAGALYRNGALRRYPKSMAGAVIAVDSAGFTAMTVHRGVYPWSVSEYLDLIEQARPAWYASRDYCVEPSIAKDDAERARRIDRTIAELDKVRAAASRRGILPPVPVLQGWNPCEYIDCWERMGRPKGLVGIGSVCRRHLRGRAGLLSILDELAANGVNATHLFGVKGQALSVICADMFLSRMVASVDSHAWDYSARMDGIRGIDNRMTYLSEWIQKQVNRRLTA